MQATLVVKKLYENIKQVINKPVAITNQYGQPYAGLNDLRNQGQFQLLGTVRPDEHSITVKDKNNLQAIPIYTDGVFYCLVILETTAEDVQMIQIITSLSTLLIQQFVNQHKPRPDSVDLLLTRLAYRPLTIDPEELEQQLLALGYRLDLPRVALAIELKGFWDHYLDASTQALGEKGDLISAKKRDVEQSLSGFFTKSLDNVVGYIGNDIFCVLKDLHDTEYGKFCELLATHLQDISGPLKNVYIREVSVGIGSLAQSATDMLRSVQEALQILRVGKSIVGPDKAYRFEELGIMPLLLNSSEEQKRSFAQRYFSALGDEELVTTVTIFLNANLNLTETAKRLKVHRNTVIYRLEKINEQLGKDPRRFEDAVELYLASLFSKMFT